MAWLTTADEVMDALGGNRPVAALTNRKPGAVSNWRAFNAFPANTYLAMIKALHAEGKDAPAALWGMVEPAEGEAAA